MPYVESRIAIAAPARAVYELAKDQERFPEFMPDVETVKGRACTDRTGSRWKTLVEEAPTERTQEDRFDDPALRIDDALLKGDLDTFEGAWTFEERDGLTHVLLTVEYDFGVPTLAELIGPTLQKKVLENSGYDAQGVETSGGTMKFCFVIHPLSLEDVARYEPGARARGAHHRENHGVDARVGRRAHHRRATPDGRETEGWFVAAPLLPEQMLKFPREEVYKRIFSRSRSVRSSVRKSRDSGHLPAWSATAGDHRGALADSGDDRQLPHHRRGRA